MSKKMKLIVVRCIVSLGLIVGCMNALALSPPQYTLWRQIANSFGASSCVEVRDIYETEEGWVVDVIGCDADVCQGLAYVLESEYNYGGIQVNVRVLDKAGTLYTAQILQENDDAEAILAKHFFNALRENPYFIRILPSQYVFFGDRVWLEFKPAIIQYFSDNIGDYYGNANEVAATVFQGVCRMEFGREGGSVSVGYTTALIPSDSQASHYQQYP